MSKLRVYELAKQLNIGSKELISTLERFGIEIQSHMSTLSPDAMKVVNEQYAAKKEDKKVTGTIIEESKNLNNKEVNQQSKPVSKHTDNNRNAGQKSYSEVNMDSKGERTGNTQNTPVNSQGQQRQGGYQNNNRSNQNRSSQGQGNTQRPQGNNQGQGNSQRSYGNNQGQGSSQRPQGNNQGQGNGQRSYGNNQGQGNGQRPQGNNQGQGNGQRPQGNNQGQGNGQRSYGNNQGQGSNQRSYGSNQGQGNTQRPHGNQGQGNAQRPQSNNNQGQGNGQRSYGNNQGQGRNQQQNRSQGNYQNRGQGGRNQGNRRPGNHQQATTPTPVKPVEKVTNIAIGNIITVKELAEKLKIQGAALVKKLFLQGTVVNINQELDFDAASLIAMEYECTVEKLIEKDLLEDFLKDEEEDPKNLKSRPPIVVVMGHVDHGKTSLLDAIRQTHVTVGEAGGITQHIGASMVEIKGERMTFLDTPGHEAFTAMRMRGALATDIAILVVAADDGVMPQTVEAINHAKAAGLDIIVAINKIDKPSANLDRVKQELVEHGLIAEDWGGETIFVPVSAISRTNIDQLLEMVLLVAEMRELRANPKKNAKGIVIEAQLDKGRGPVATILVQQGTLHIGDSIVAGAAFGKVRAMIDHKGRRVKEAGPSTPVEILGLSEAPLAGDFFAVADNDKIAREISEIVVSRGREKLLEDTKAKMSLDDLFTQIQAGNVKELPIVVKADVQGSVEAVKQSLVKLSNDEVVIKIIHEGVGAVTKSDVMLASASNAIIIGFNVRPDVTAKVEADYEKVDIRLYRVIYNAIEDIEAAMKGLLDPTFEEKVIGHAEVRQTFKVSSVGTIAGSYVLDGKFTRHCSVRIVRDGIVVYEGALASLKRFKDDVKEVNTGYECGFMFEKFNDVKEGDKVEGFVMEEIPR